MSFEQIPEARIIRKEITPLGPEVEINVKGNILVIRPYKGKLTITSSRTPDTSFESLSPATIRIVEKAFSELTEEA